MCVKSMKCIQSPSRTQSFLRFAKWCHIETPSVAKFFENLLNWRTTRRISFSESQHKVPCYKLLRHFHRLKRQYSSKVVVSSLFLLLMLRSINIRRTLFQNTYIINIYKKRFEQY